MDNLGEKEQICHTSIVFLFCFDFSKDGLVLSHTYEGQYLCSIC